MKNLTIIAILLILLGIKGIVAQNCPETKPPAKLSKFVLVFSGKVTEIEAQPSNLILKFQIERVWQGDLVKEIKIVFPLAAKSENTGDKIKFQKGESYLIYASLKSELFNENHLDIGLDKVGLIVNECSHSKKIADAGEDLKVLGEGFSVNEIEENRSAKTELIPELNKRTIRFPSGYKVIIEAQGQENYTIVIFGYLSTSVTSVTSSSELKRLSPKDRRVYIGLKNGEKGSFVIPQALEDEFVDFQIQSVKVQIKPLESFQDKGEIEVGKMSLKTENSGGKPYVELSELPKDFKIKVSWSKSTTQ